MVLCGFADVTGVEVDGTEQPTSPGPVPMCVAVSIPEVTAEDGAVLRLVGDAGPDIGVARRAGIPVIGVEFGYTDVPIADLKPDLLIGHFRDLPAAVTRLLPGKSS